MRSPLQGAVHLKFPTFRLTTALQHCKLFLSRRSAKRVGGLFDDEAVASPMSVSLIYCFLPFIFSLRF